MTALAQITLENEMDLTLAYKKSMRTAELLGLTLATQTAFSTAVSEVCREVIDKAQNGALTLAAVSDAGKFYLTALVKCQTSEYFNKSNEGIDYARKLVPILEITAADESLEIMLKLSIPRSTQISQPRVLAVKTRIEQEGPLSAYEEVKIRNSELIRLNQQKELALMNANYLNEKKTEFLSIAAHELNTPLTVLRSYGELALRIDNGQQEKLTDTLKKIQSQSNKVVTLIRQLLDISKLEAGEIIYTKEHVQWQDFLAKATQDLQLAVPKHKLTLEQNADAGVYIDPLRIEQVLYNIIGNAAKYSSPASSINVSTKSDKGKIYISVTDEGIGMNSQTIKNIFQKFYRGDDAIRKYNGLGMGLYVASRIISDHDGSVDVASTEGKGSTFTFSLPVTAQA